MKGNYKDGKRDGPHVFYNEHGQLLEKGNYKDGKEDGPWVKHYVHGPLGWKGNYKDGERDGPWEFYFYDCTKDAKKSGTYRDDKKVE